MTCLYIQQTGMPTQANGFAGTLLALIPATLGALAGAWWQHSRAAARS